MTILNRIKDYKLQEIALAKQQQSINDLMDIIREKNDKPRGFFDALKNKKQLNQIGLIAEIKKASPSKGLIRPDFDVPSLASAYQEGGATCLSILTDTPSFQGHDDFLSLGRNAVKLPVLRKDFMFDNYQIVQSAALGSDCILLIMACLDNQQAIELEQTALEYNMDILIETHNHSELERALTYLKSDLIGINNRDLHNFETDIATSEHLVALLPPEKLCVSESGIFTIEDIQRLQKHKIQSFLIGESLMRQQDVCAATKKITQI